MVRDYETPTVPPTWESFARAWAARLGLANKEVSLTCSPDRYGIAVVLRVVRADGVVCIATRRSSDADDAVERRARFLAAVGAADITKIELDVAGYYVGEGTVDCVLCPGVPKHPEWQHTIVRELLRIAEPPAEPAGALAPEDADDAELAALDQQVAEHLATLS